MIRFRTSRLVEFSDTDLAGIVHFANFFRYMEAAEHAFLRSRGLSVKLRLGDQVLGFPRVHAHCDYVRPAKFEDTLDIAVSIERLGTKSVSYGFEFTHEGEVVARGQMTCVCCRMTADHKLEPIEIPAELRAQLDAEPHA